MIKIITAQQTIPIRKSVLRNNKDISCVFDGDTNTTTFHLGAFDNEKLVGIASFMNKDSSLLQGKQYQLRGMATLPNVRGLGYGKKLVQQGCTILTEKKIDVLWCNARAIAVSFYEQLGFNSYGDYFEIPEIGKHIVMCKML